MSGPDRSNKGTEDEETQRQPGSWRAVDSEIWRRRSPPPSGFRRLRLALERVGSLLVHPLALPMVAMFGVFGFIMTFVAAYSIGGPGFFGPVLLAIWGSAMTVLVLVLEKSGYSKNFEAWDFPVRKILYGIPGLFLGLAFFYIFLTVLGHH